MEQGNVVQKNNATVSIGYIHKKTEKLVTAIYMLSNFFPHQEPLRWEVRTFSLNLLGNISFVFYGKNSETDHILKEGINAIDEIISRFEISHIAGLVSSMNFTVLKNELVSLKDNIHSVRAGGGGQNITITSEFFSPTKFSEEQNSVHRLVSDNLSPAIGNTTLMSRPVKSNKEAIIPSPQKPHTKNVHSTSRTDLKVTETSMSFNQKGHNESVASKRKEDRSETILAILKKKNNLTVKDIAHVISDCSEKTIQRELLALVSKHVLKKVGERRWSRYSLA